jgi:leader peptidase (prepilin peptidase)/N-methyltransferase
MILSPLFLLDYLFIFSIGLCFGSFCNVLIYRMPKGLSFVTPSSRCPKCNTRIKLYHNIPLLSFLLLKGRCYSCNEKISFTYFFVELIIGILFLGLFYIHSFSLEFILLSFIFSFLVSLAIMDLNHTHIPESLAIFTLLLSFIFQISKGVYFDIFILMGFFYAIRLIVSYILKQEAMGEGDIIIAGIIGAILGIEASIEAILLACAIAIPFAIYLRVKGELETPFVPFLAISLVLIYFYKNINIDILI